MLFLSLYTPAEKTSGPPSAEKMAEMGALIEKFTREDTLVFTGPLGMSGPGGAKIRLEKGSVMVKHGPLSGTTLMGASGFALIRANSRDEAVVKSEEFLAVAGDGECEILQVLEMGPPPGQQS